MSNTWPAKTAAERVTAQFDFGPDLEPGDSITTIEWVVTLLSGVDATPTQVLVGAAAIKGSRVFQKLGGLAGCSYRIECRANTAQENLLSLWRVLPVTTL